MRAINAGLANNNFKHKDELIRPGDSQAQNDRRMVRFEQRMVQTALNTIREQDPKGYDRMVREVNSTLNSGSAQSSFIAGSVYADAIASTREQIGGDIDFANEAHRVAIGDALTAALREQPGRSCRQVTGSRIQRC